MVSMLIWLAIKINKVVKSSFVSKENTKNRFTRINTCRVRKIKASNLRMGDNFGIHRSAVRSGTEDRTQGQILSDFLSNLEDYTPTIPDAVTSHYLNSSGFETSDPRIVRLISIAAQKFISDVANDALQHCKTRTSNAPSSGSHGSAKNPKATKKYTLTMEDLAPALGDYGITARKAYYFV